MVFVSDNGTCPTAYRWAKIHGKLLSGSKLSMLEGGALVPCIVNWPNKVPAGKVTESLINICDFYPTLGKIAGAQMPTGVTIDDRDFSAPLLGQSEKWPRDWIFVQLSRWCYARDMNWKLNQAKELVDMHQAPFLETLVPPNSNQEVTLAESKKLQEVLDELNPAGGIVDPKKETIREKAYVKYLSKAGPTHSNPNNVQEHPLTGQGSGKASLEDQNGPDE